MIKSLCTTLLIVLATCLLPATSRADTIGTWHIYRNKITIFDNVWAKSPLIHLRDLRAEEKIGVGYYHCAKESDPVRRSIELWTDDKRLVKKYSDVVDDERPFYIRANDLISFWRENPRKKLYLTFKQQYGKGFEVHDSLVVLAQ
jgi:hypothetical protein